VAAERRLDVRRVEERRECARHRRWPTDSCAIPFLRNGEGELAADFALEDDPVVRGRERPDFRPSQPVASPHCRREKARCLGVCRAGVDGAVTKTILAEALHARRPKDMRPSRA
jgi:hypothetical protein